MDAQNFHMQPFAAIILERDNTIKALEAQLVLKTAYIAALEAEVGKRPQAQEAAIQQARELQGRLDELQGRLDAKESRAADQKAQLEANAVEIARLKADLAAEYKTSAALAKQVSALQGRLAETEGMLAETEGMLVAAKKGRGRGQCGGCVCQSSKGSTGFLQQGSDGGRYARPLGSTPPCSPSRSCRPRAAERACRNQWTCSLHALVILVFLVVVFNPARSSAAVGLGSRRQRQQWGQQQERRQRGGR